MASITEADKMLAAASNICRRFAANADEYYDKLPWVENQVCAYGDERVRRAREDAAKELATLRAERDALQSKLESAERAVRVCQNAARTLDAGRQEVIRNLQKPIRDERNAVATLDSEREANAVLTAENEALRCELAALKGDHQNG